MNRPQYPMNKDSESYNLILNSSNIVANSNNSILEYRFPSATMFKAGDKIALSNLNIFYSWFNFTSSNNNLLFKYIWTDGSINDILIESGFYDVSALNEYLQSKFIANKHYLIDGAGDYIYYIELVENLNKYAVQLNFFTVPTSTQATTLGYTQPSGATWSFPVSAITPQLDLTFSNFNNNIGFNQAKYPSSPSSSTVSFLSSKTPQITSINSMILNCSLVSSKYSQNAQSLYTFDFGNSSFGESIDASPRELSFINITPGIYQSLRLQFVDNNYNPVQILDEAITVLLVLKESA